MTETKQESQTIVKEQSNEIQNAIEIKFTPEQIAEQEKKKQELLADAVAKQLIDFEVAEKEKRQKEYDEFFQSGFHREEFYLPEINAHNERAIELLQFKVTKRFYIAICFTAIAFLVMFLL